MVYFYYREIYLKYRGDSMREHEQIKEFAIEDIISLVRKTDLSNPNTFLVLNGGTGVGKTTAIMNSVLGELEKKTGKM